MTSSAYALQLNKMCSDICLEAIVKNRWKAVHFFLSFDVWSVVKEFPSFVEEPKEFVWTPVIQSTSKFPLIRIGKWGGVQCYLVDGSDVIQLVSVN